MIVVPFIPVHLEGFVAQKEQGLVNKYMLSEDYIDVITNYGPAFTGLVSGVPVIVSGVLQVHPHIGMAWAILSEECRNHLLPATRAVASFLEGYKMSRIETAVKRDFAQGHRWAKMLGFENETPERGMRNFTEDGETYDLYARYN